jgi:phosphoenolpyruvate-protein phosphotransferase/dihydroxyacetone kinase phosphotransfer subunit
VVGIVLVSHSAALAEGVAELAREMAGPDVPIEPAGGVEGAALGTDAVRVADAIKRADRGDGVLVLMDLGSAVLSAELARDLVGEAAERVLLSEAPFVEGAVAAAVAARVGGALAEVAAEARAGVRAKAAHLGSDDGDAPAAPVVDGDQTVRLVVSNPLGLHARPAARLVQTATAFDAQVTVTNVSAGRGPASARSLSAVATLGVRSGEEVLVAASGLQAAEALAAITALAARDFDESAEPPPVEQPQVRARQAVAGRLDGLPAAPGLALAEARHFRAPEPVGEPEADWAALERALASVRDEVAAARDAVAARDGYAAAIFDAHLLILADEALLAPAREATNAARAWNDAAEATAAAYRKLDDEYLRARADDVEALRRRVVAHVLGTAEAAPSLSAPGILVAPELTPAETATLDRELVRGIATAYGGPTGHSAILARSLGLPAVVGLGEAVLALDEGARLLLDGDAGSVWIEPDAELVSAHEARVRERETSARSAREAAAAPAVTRDGRRIEVAANVGSAEDAAAAAANGADGVGLLRTEFLFLGRESLPDEDEQAAAYAEIASRLDGRPLIVRTLDVGADKPLPALRQPPEANPFLGVRGIRLGLADPALLETQLRAVLRVAADHPLKVMFPMVATVDELRAALALLERLGPRPAGFEVGVMIEVPAAALSAAALAPLVDFFSVGTNDLAQYTLAADRGNERVGSLADALHPAVLRLIASAAEAASAHRRWIGVCGELASDPLAAAALVGLGVTELSVSPPRVPEIKQAVRAVDAASAAALARELLQAASAADVRARLAEAA